MAEGVKHVTETDTIYTKKGGKMNERELVSEYKIAKEEVERLEESLKTAKDRFDKAQIRLVDELQSKQASKTARYDGLGCVTLKKPIVGARTTNEEQLFEYLKSIGRDDLFKLTCHHRSLSSFVKEMIENGKQHELPDFIEVWFKPSTMLTK